jgi:hypothetical protein
MKKFSLVSLTIYVPLLAAVFLPVSVSASTVTYDTTASQLCVGAIGCGVNTQTIGGTVILTFSGNSQTVTASPTTFGTLGSLFVTCVGGGTSCGSQSLSGLNLFINISQTVPLVGNGSFPGGVITGSVSGTASNASISFGSPSNVLLAPILYDVSGINIPLVPPSTGGGQSTIIGTITDTTAVPLPASLSLFLAGLAALGGWTLKSRRFHQRGAATPG